MLPKMSMGLCQFKGRERPFPDWHKFDEKENNADQTKLVDNKTYLDWILEMG